MGGASSKNLEPGAPEKEQRRSPLKMGNAIQVKVKSPMKSPKALLSPEQQNEDNTVSEWKPRVFAVPQVKLEEVALVDCDTDDFGLEDFKENSSSNNSMFGISTLSTSKHNRASRQRQYMSP
jgi:hypothetical protein